MDDPMWIYATLLFWNIPIHTLMTCPYSQSPAAPGLNYVHDHHRSISLRIPYIWNEARFCHELRSIASVDYVDTPTLPPYWMCFLSRCSVSDTLFCNMTYYWWPTVWQTRQFPELRPLLKNSKSTTFKKRTPKGHFFTDPITMQQTRG